MSAASKAGSSAAAKCPPRGISVQRSMLYPRATHSRGGNGASKGNRAIAQGRRTDSPGANCSGAFLTSLYKRKDDEIVSVIQYSVTFESSSSLVNRVSTSPLQSDQSRNFSMIQ